MKKSLTAIAAGLALGAMMFTGCAGGSPQPSGGSGDGAKIEVSNGEIFQGKTKVAVGSFKVAFITEQKMTSKNRGSFMGGGEGSARASALVKLKGVSNETMQAITDAAYADFVAQLKAKGYEVVPYETLSAQKTFTKTGTEASPYEVSEPLPAYFADALLFAPSSMKLRFLNGQGEGTFAGAEYGYGETAEAMGIPVIDVHNLISFAAFTMESSRSTASIEVDQAVMAVRGGKMEVINGLSSTFTNNTGRVTLTTEIVSTEKFAKIVQEEESTSDAVGDMLASAVGSLLGGGDRAMNTYIYEADAAKFKSAAIKVLENANGEFVAAIASGK